MARQQSISAVAKSMYAPCQRKRDRGCGGRRRRTQDEQASIVSTEPRGIMSASFLPSWARAATRRPFSKIMNSSCVCISLFVLFLICYLSSQVFVLSVARDIRDSVNEVDRPPSIPTPSSSSLWLQHPCPTILVPCKALAWAKTRRTSR